jgi:hypothetical protein
VAGVGSSEAVTQQAMTAMVLGLRSA